MILSFGSPSIPFVAGVGRSTLERPGIGHSTVPLPGGKNKRLVLRRCGPEEGQGSGSRSFLTMKEADLVEISGLSTHERFQCQLTIWSLNLLRVITEREGCSIEGLNAGRVCDWFLKDKLKREQNIVSAVLQWDDSEFPF